MFRVLRTAKQIFRTARNIGKYSSQSKGYVEDANDEFVFNRALPESATVKLWHNSQSNLIDSAAIRKLIYARFADEIVASSKNASAIDTNSNDTREYIGDAVTTYNITDEFKGLKSQGYDFAVARKAIENQNVKSLVERMKELVVSGHISSYSGEAGLKEAVEELMHKKALVIEEFMQRLTGELEVHSTELLG